MHLLTHACAVAEGVVQPRALARLTGRRHFYISRNMETHVAAAALAALAQEARLAVFRMLVQAGPDGLPVGRIGKALSIPPATLSFHLAQLKHAGLVTVRRNGRQLIHAASFARMDELLGYLTDNCCGQGAPASVAPCKPARRRRKSV